MRPDPVIFMIVALLCAAGLVVYLQDRALRALDGQTTALVQKVAEQTLEQISHEIRGTFDGPVFDTIAAVNHPHLVDRRLDLVAREFARGLSRYPHVERFLVWSGRDTDARPEDVRFFGDRACTTAQIEAATDLDTFFTADPVLAPHVLAAAQRTGRSQKIYAMTSVDIHGAPHQVFVRVLYTNAARVHYFAVLGFVVDPHRVRTALFPALFERRLGALLRSRDGGVDFDLRVEDEAGGHVFGPRQPFSPEVSAATALPMQFYPGDDIRTRMAHGVTAPEWTLSVGPSGEQASALLVATRRQSWLLSAASVLLMLVALVFALLGSRRAAQLAHMQADFVAHVSHQLKTPVSLLSAASETLALDRVRAPEKLSQFLDIVRVEAGHLSALVERILEFSRTSDGARTYEREPVPLVPFVTDTVDAFARAVAPVGYRIQVLPADVQPVVYADPMAIEQALVNLLDNAVKYSGDSRAIEVRVGQTPGEGTVDVVDHGVGIAPAEHERVFERFCRGAGASLHRQGFGLGLTLVRELLTAQGGHVALAESTPGRGSTFRMRIPLVAGAHRPATGPLAWARAWLGRRPGPAAPTRETS